MNMEALTEKLFTLASELAFRLLSALLLLAIGRWCIKVIMRSVKKSRLIQRTDPAVERFLIHSVGVALNVLLAASAVAILGVPMTSALALLTSAGVAVGLALQGALGNLAGGIMILVFHPFRLENFIELGEFSGTVIDIGFFYTTLHTPDHRRVTIPNGTVMGAEIVNYSANPTRRLDMVFSVSYGHSPQRIREFLLEEVARYGGALTDPPPFCRLTQQGLNGLEFTLRVWVATTDYWNVKFDLLEAIHDRLTSEGITVPYPQLDVHMKEQ